MPIFEYVCGGCGKRFEHLLRSAGDVPVQCPHCGGKNLQKALSGFSVSVSGGGRKNEPSAACATCSSGSCPYSGD